MAIKTDPGISPRGYTLYPGGFFEFISLCGQKTFIAVHALLLRRPAHRSEIMTNELSRFYQQMCERLERLNVLPRHNEMVIAIGFFLVIFLVVILGTRPFSRLLSRH
jgi:hypothetical protein